MKIRWRTFFLAVVLLPLLMSGCSTARPLHRSQGSIRASLLKRTPPGTAKAAVEAFIAKEGWNAHVPEPTGIEEPETPSMLERASAQPGNPPVTKEMPGLVQAFFGSYIILIGNCYVYGIWGFDGDDHLVDIWVYKLRDVL